MKYTPLSFTMELEDSGKLPFLGMVIIRNGPRLDTKVYVKPTDTELLLHYQSHVVLKTMLNRAFKLSSNWKFFRQECERLKMVFAQLHYPETLIVVLLLTAKNNPNCSFCDKSMKLPRMTNLYKVNIF